MSSYIPPLLDKILIENYMLECINVSEDLIEDKKIILKIFINKSTCVVLSDCFLLSLFRGFSTTYWQISSSLERLKNLRILLALFGPRR